MIADNPVSVTLSSGESVTVPTGESWKITGHFAKSGDVRINGQIIGRYEFETVLNEGDSISSDYGGHIGGWSV